MTDYIFDHNWFNTLEESWNNNWQQEGCPTNLKCLEIGCFQGQSSLWILEHLVGVEGCLYAIDLFHQEKIFDHNIKTAKKENLTIKIKGDAVIEMSALLKEHESTFDFIYIDASKLASENCFALLIAERLLKLNGKIIVDDFLWSRSYGKDQRECPRLGIILFEQLSLLCKSVRPPTQSQYSFQKIRTTDYFVKLKAEL